MKIARRSPSSSRLDRWFGRGELEAISASMRGWYGGPILVGNTPDGRALWAHKGGDFSGAFSAGGFASLRDFASATFNRWAREQAHTFGVGFPNVAALVDAIRAKRKDWPFSKALNSGVGSCGVEAWAVGSLPAVGTIGAAAPGGTAYDRTSAGALGQVNAPPGEALYFAGASLLTGAPTTAVLLDRLFAVAKTMNSVATEAVTGVPTRYQGATPGQADYAENNILYVHASTTLAATAHNWTVCQYLNQAGNPATLPTIPGVSACNVNRFDFAGAGPGNLAEWFTPLAAGDTGIKALTQMQCDALVATGTVQFTIAHPLAFLPVPFATVTVVHEAINPLWLARILDDACLALIAITNTNTPSLSGTISTVSI